MSSDNGDTPQERDELERLRARVDRLQEELQTAQGGDTTAPPPGRRRGVWRPIVVAVLLALVFVISPLAVVATWAHDEISDTDRYVETVTPLASDPAVQEAITERVTDEIFTRLDIEAVTDEAIDALAARGLPPRVATSLSALATPLANGVRNFVSEQVGRLVRSAVFQEAWAAANREAHHQMVAVLTGKTGNAAVEVSGDSVAVNLAAVIDAVKQELEDAGFALASRIPEVNAEFTILESADLTRAQTGFRLMSAAARVLPVLALILLAAAVAVGASRRRTLVIAALAVAFSMVALGVMLNLFRIVYLDAVPSDELPQDAAAAVYDTLVGFIRLNLRAVLVLFLAIALIAWVSGPSASASAVRRGTTGLLDSVRHGSDRAGLNTGPLGVAAYTYRTPIRVTVLAAALLVYVMAAHPTGAWTVGVLLVAGLILLLVELIARPPQAAEGAPPPSETPLRGGSAGPRR